MTTQMKVRIGSAEISLVELQIIQVPCYRVWRYNSLIPQYHQPAYKEDELGKFILLHQNLSWAGLYTHKVGDRSRKLVIRW